MDPITERIRVLHVITRLVPGGADENTLATVEGLDKSRFEVDLLIGGQSDFVFASRIKSSRLMILPELIREPHPWFDLVAFYKMCRIIRSRRYHIVHTHTAKAGMLGRLAGFFSNTPKVVHTLHGSTFHESLHPLRRRMYRWMERIVGRATHQFVTVGEDLRDIYLDAHIGRADRYITIRSGFELERFRLSDDEIRLRSQRVRESLGVSPTATVVGAVGRLEKRKGQKFIIEAAQRIVVKYPETIFFIVGDGPAGRELTAYARQLGVDRQILFLGHRHDIEDVMAAMDVFVLSSLWEGLPRVLVQAAALGKPIVSFDIEGAGEVVTDGRNGFIVPLRDVASMADRIAGLVSDPATAQRMGSAGRQAVTGEWDVATMIKRISALYDRLLPQMK